MRRSLLLVVVVMIGCAHDVRARYPTLPDAPTGSVVLLMSDAASDVSVAVNGILVVDGAHTKRIVIDNIPTGNTDIVMTANGGDKAMRVFVDSDHATTIPMGIGDGGGPTGFLKTIFASIVTMTVYALLH
jgi:hypothetical protein